MNKRYRLLKDLPDCVSGTVGEFSESENSYKFEKTGVWVSPHRYLYYSAGTVTQSPEWFEEVVDRIEVQFGETSIGLKSEQFYYTILFGNYQRISEDKFPAIKKVIEFVLNGDIVEEKTFTLQQMEQCFNAAKEMAPRDANSGCEARKKYTTFEDYKNTIL